MTEYAVTVQLVNVQNGTPQWAQKFDEQFTNIFSVQDSISEQVATALALNLTSEERKTTDQALHRQHGSLSALSQGLVRVEQVYV